MRFDTEQLHLLILSVVMLVSLIAIVPIGITDVAVGCDPTTGDGCEGEEDGYDFGIETEPDTYQDMGRVITGPPEVYLASYDQFSEEWEPWPYHPVEVTAYDWGSGEELNVVGDIVVETDENGIATFDNIAIEEPTEGGVDAYLEFTVEDGAGGEDTVDSSGFQLQSTSPHIEITSSDFPDEGTVGETISVNYDVRNQGSESLDDGLTEYTSDADFYDNSVLALDGFESASRSFDYTVEEDAGDEVELSIYTGDDSTSEIVNILTEADFQIIDDSIVGPATENEAFDMPVSVENKGDLQETKSVDVTVVDTESQSGVYSDSTEMTLDGGQQKEYTFTWTPEFDDAGEYTVEVDTPDDSISVSVIVEEVPPNFQIDSVDFPEPPVPLEESVDIEATITNVGGSGTLAVESDIGMHGNGDSEDLSLDHDGSYSVTLSVFYETGGDVTTTFETANDSVSEDVTVGADFVLQDIDYPSAVSVGEELTMTATVENVAAEDDGLSGFVIAEEFPLGEGEEPEFAEQESYTLGQTDTTTISQTWDTSGQDVGDYDLLISAVPDSGGDADEHVGEVTLHPEDSDPPHFDVSMTGTNSPVESGGGVTAEATIHNLGEEPGEQTVHLDVSDGVGQVDDTTVHLDPDESETVELTWQTSEDDGGSYDLEVASDDSSDSTTVEVELPETDEPRFSLSLSDVPEEVTAGETVTADVIVTNTGGATGTESVTFQVGDTDLDEGEVELDPGSTGTLEFEWETDENDIGSHEIAAYTDDRITSDTVEVVGEDVDPANFDVSIVGVDDPVAPGETVVVDVSITNTGEESEAQDIDFSVEGDVTDDSPVELDPDETTDLTFEWSTEEAGTYELAVLSDDNSDTAAVTVGEPRFEVTLDHLEYHDDNGSIAVNATIENTGPVAGSQEISASGNGSLHDTQTLELGAEESEQLAFSWALEDLEVEQYDVEIASLDDADEGIETLELESEEEEDEDDGTVSPSSSILLFVLIGGIVGVYLYSRIRGSGGSESSTGQTESGEGT